MTLILRIQNTKQAVSHSFVALAILTALVPLALSYPVRAQTWTQTSAPTYDWRAVACSADGRVMAVGAYISTNYGATWFSNDSLVAPEAIAVSADGLRLAAAADAIFVSTNSGVTWRSNSIGGSYGSLACSADGLVLASYASQFSTNSGETWFTATPPPVPGSGPVSLSADGKTVVGFAGNTFIVSTNLGQDWVIQGALPVGLAPRIITASADCARLAEADIGNIFTSIDAGATWRSNSFPVRGQWLSIASSADGLRLAAVNYFGQIYTSTNSGLNWISNNAPSLDWISVASSADGRRLVAVLLGGGIWTSYSPGAPVLEIAPTNNLIKISWLIPSAEFVLEQTFDLHSTNWSAVDAIPTLNASNLHYEVSMPISGSNAFYRLRMR